MTECAEKKLLRKALCPGLAGCLSAGWEYLKWVSLEKAGILSYRRLLKPPHSTVLKAAEN